MLERVGGVEVVEQAASVIQALARLQEESFDVLFLDIRMPGLSGLEAMEVINRLPRRPEVVLVTAVDEHALAAFEVSATDYLLKPVSELRLRHAVQRIAALRSRDPALATGLVSPRSPTRIPVEADEHTLLLRIGEIRFVHVRGHTVLVRAFDAEHRSRSSLAELEELLVPHGFIRVHRSFLVNLEHVLEVHPFFAGAYILRVDDRQRSEVPVSRAMAPRLSELLRL